MKYRRFAPIGVLRYSSEFLIRPESTPDHVMELVVLALKIHKDLTELGLVIDLNRLMFKIVIHDLDESITGDIKKPFKYFIPELTKLMKLATSEMLKRAGFDQFIITEIENDKDDGTIEGFLLNWLDTLQVVLKLYEEVKHLGNLTIAKELKGAHEYLGHHLRNSFLKTKEEYDTILRDYLSNQYSSIII